MSDNIRAAILGGSECGKTTLAAAFSLHLWKTRGLRTLAFDPWLKESPKRWGNHAWATPDFDQWRNVVRRVKGCCVVWDEATTNGGRDRENLELFTAIRHDHPVLLFLGHEFAAALPPMRACLTDLFLARADTEEADKWKRKFADADVMKATGLDQYQFLHKRAFRPVRILAPSIAEIRAGVAIR